MNYIAPVSDMLFNLRHIAKLDELAQLPGLEDASLETAQAVLNECAKFTQEVVAPLNHSADQAPSYLKDGQVHTSAGFPDAYKKFVAGGWQGLQHPVDFGGQDLPKTIGAQCIEMLTSASLSFSLAPILTNGAIEAMLTAGSDTLKALLLEKLVTGQWAGTMNLTESQAGSDLAQIRSRAEPTADGQYKIFGTKIFITYGDQDLTENIVHLVLARVSGAPEGVKGISLFMVPKFLINADGSLGARNDVQCVSLEHKLGIKASPTAVLQYGDASGALGYLVGEENRGLEYMFIMMNAARYDVGMQGVGLAERAYQHAVAYAQDRVQSRPVDGSAKHSVAIIQHPDVRRMLMTMRSLTQGCRAMATYAAAAYDRAHHGPEAEREANQALYEFLVPLVKGFSTEMSLEVAQLGVQVHGGMGYIEETGAAQHLRDAKILAIYEGTTAIQANDLVGRKTVRDGGQLAHSIVAQMLQTASRLQAHGAPQAQAIASSLSAAAQALAQSIEFMVQHAKSAPNAAYAGSVPYLLLAGNAVAGWQMAESWLAADSLGAEDQAFAKAKKITAAFYAQHLLPRCAAAADSICNGAESVMALANADF